MAIAGINAKIKSVIEALTTPTIYIRAINLNEANYKLPKTAIGIQPVGINANTSEIVFNTSITTYTTFLFPIDVWFVKQNTGTDDTGEQIDIILDEMFLLANEFYDKMVPQEGSGIELIADYTLTPIINQFDELLTGYQITFEFPDKRTVYGC